LLPGLQQDIGRAELFAGLCAIRAFTEVDIYTDSGVFYGGLWSILKQVESGWVPVLPKVNRDLWVRIYEEIEDRVGTVRVFKVKAHRDIAQAKDSKEAWGIYNNDRADALAKKALRSLDGGFLLKRQRIATEAEGRRIQMRRMHAWIADTAEVFMKREDEQGDVGQEGDSVVQDGEVEGPFQPQVQYNVPQVLASGVHLGTQYFAKVLEWAGKLEWPVEGTQIGVTWVELLVDFRLYAGMRPPVKQGVWADLESAHGSLYERCLDLEVHAFVIHIKEIEKAVGGLFKAARVRSTKSESMWGYNKPLAGLASRPKMTKGCEAVEVLRGAMRGRRSQDRNLKFNLVVPGEVVVRQEETLEYGKRLKNFQRCVRARAMAQAGG